MGCGLWSVSSGTVRPSVVHEKSEVENKAPKRFSGKAVSWLPGTVQKNSKQSHRVLVAGGAGFIGSCLCRHLVDSGSKVICVDNFHTGAEVNLRGILHRSNFQLLRHDVLQPLELEVDRIYNLASPASPVQYQRNPILTAKTNVLGTLNLLDLARQTGARFLQASTSEIYGDPLVHPQPEEYWGNVNPIGPRSCYDEGKRMAETFCLDFHRTYGIPVKIARIFNTYGPNMALDDGRVVSKFVAQALRGEPITIFGDGSQTRSFCYVSDLVLGLVELMEQTDEAFTGPLNLGNPQECTILDLAKIIIRLTGSASSLVYRDLPIDDPVRRRPDISLARRLLDWEPTIDLTTGLLRLIEDYRLTIEGKCSSNI